MKTTLVFLTFLVALVTSEILVPKNVNKTKYVGRNFLMKQKFVLDVLKNIYQPLQQQEYLSDIGDGFIEDAVHYKKYEPVSRFFQEIKIETLPKDYLFTVYNPKHLKYAKGLFNVFYYSNDWQTFYKNVLWARQNMNEGLFVYALNLAIIHRSDMNGIVLPAPYEISPYLFYTSNIWAEINSRIIANTATLIPGSFYTISTNYTDKFSYMNKETNLAYFTEDIDWNSYNYYLNLMYPFWMDGNDFDLNKKQRGELYLYLHQQILARYFSERLSNNYGNIPLFSWLLPIKTGYNPYMRHHNGLQFSIRKNYYNIMLSAVANENSDTLELIEDNERRIRDIIDMGYYVLPTGERIDLRIPENIEYVGNLIQSNPDSVDRNFINYFAIIASKLLRGDTNDISSSNPSNVYSPSVLEYHETEMRDPIYYQLYNRIIQQYSEFKDYLQPYTYDDLFVPGVTVQNVSTTRLVTYFDYFNADITNAIDNPKNDIKIFARQKRLNHRPFTITLDILSDEVKKVVIRLYLAPTLDRHRLPFNLKNNRDNFIQLDQFVYDLPVGKVTIQRNSNEFYWSIKDRTKYSQLYENVLKGLNLNNDQLVFNDQTVNYCGFPDRLILPRGWISGFPMKLFVIVTPYNATDEEQQDTYDNHVDCSNNGGFNKIDNLPFGYPFDRAIDETAFKTPNMFFKDVAVFYMPEKMLTNLADLNPKWAWKLENVMFPNY